MQTSNDLSYVHHAITRDHPAHNVANLVGIEVLFQSLEKRLVDDPSHLFQPLANFGGIEAAAPCLENRAALHVDLAHVIGRQIYHLMLVRLRKAIVPAGGTNDVPRGHDAVVIIQRMRHTADDRV